MEWKHPGSAAPKKINRVPSAVKMMASFLWDSQWKIMIDYLEQGRIINGKYNADKMRRLRQVKAFKKRGN
jgi:hypothetical protein